MSRIGRGLAAAFLAGVLCMGAFLPSGFAAEGPPRAGEPFPDFVIPAPVLMEEARYLGLEGKTPFKLTQVRADMVILEVFSMYCPYCQREAPAVNEFHGAIQERKLGDRIKIVGLGAGNSPFEVNAFRRLYGIPFPLIPDEDFALHRALGDVRTPYFIVVRLEQKGPARVIYSQSGSIGDPAAFLDGILQSGKK